MSSADTAFYDQKSAIFVILVNTEKLHLDTLILILLTFNESLKVFSINLITILIMSAKSASPGDLKIVS